MLYQELTFMAGCSVTFFLALKCNKSKYAV